MDYTMIYGVVLKRAGKVIRTLLYRLSYFNRINAIDLLRSSIFAEDFVGEAQYSGECINNVFWPGRARESMKKTHDNDKGHAVTTTLIITNKVVLSLFLIIHAFNGLSYKEERLSGFATFTLL
jgi:hypothetical protein